MSNATLPIAQFRHQVVSTIGDHQVTIIVAETGAGKSTQAPQYLLEEGYSLVVTQPRRLAARTVAERVAEEHGTPFGDVVGYRVGGNAENDRQFSDATRCLFVTDGLALVRELAGAGKHKLMMVDEVHEWNLNVEVLVAWIKRQIEEGSDMKFVLTSATLEAERLSEYFDGAPIIRVPGRTFPVEEKDPVGPTMEDDVANLLRQGRNVLVFQPGKDEITATIAQLQRMGINAEILPLHGGLTREEQQACFRHYGRPKCVVSTNVAQTSVTIDDIDAVVDSGMARQPQIRDGVEGLYLVPISLADSTQRKGRAGRTKPGIYVDWCPEPYDRRPKFPQAEILRTRLEQTVLRLAEAGLDIEDLEFFHQPDLEDIREAKRALVALGCMDEQGQVTRIGRRASKMPVSVKYARMVIEAERLGVVDDVITVAAILEQGGIVARACPRCKRYGEKICKCWHGKMAAGETTSDLIAQLLAYKKCAGMNNNQMLENGMFVKSYREARRKREQLAKALKASVDSSVSGTPTGKLQNILRAVCAGMVDHLYVSVGAGRYMNGDRIERELARESVVIPRIDGQSQPWLVGVPFDIEVKTRRGPAMLNLLTLATQVDPSWLTEVAPHLSRVTRGVSPRYDADLDEVVSTTETRFNGQVIKSEETLDPQHVDAQALRRRGREIQQWQAWTVRPEITLLTAADGTVTVPEVSVHAYGMDVETGTPFLAYGTLTRSTSGWYSESEFKTVWTRDRAEADQTRVYAVEYLGRMRAEATRVAERQRNAAQANALRQAAEPLRLQLTELSNEHGTEFSSGLRTRIYRAQQFPYTVDPESMQAWSATARELIKEVEETCDALQTARSLRNDVNGLLCDDQQERIVGPMLDGLNALDVDDYSLPGDLNELTAWISRATLALARARDFLAKPVSNGVDSDMLAALANKFGSRR